MESMDGAEFKGSTNARLSNLERQVETIMTNHLPHLQAGLDRIEASLDQISVRISMWALGILGSLFVGTIIFLLNNK